MTIEIIERNLRIDICGFSGTVVNNEYVQTAFRLMDKMWQVVKSEGLKNKGINTWIYDDDKVFAGVELEDAGNQESGLERKTITLRRYAYYKHIGSYGLIKHVGQNMREELRTKGFETCSPYVEIYGHWTNEESKLETELLISLK